ncbi:DUF1963 domain-containing protein [Patulibacter sp. NPDC049589]|uniref:DUF1963 domain-containing protein n=1 Tax=Patulibacter sp. NPDC049589 TaxID=3154731 RepID=UPI00341D2635
MPRPLVLLACAVVVVCLVGPALWGTAGGSDGSGVPGSRTTASAAPPVVQPPVTEDRKTRLALKRLLLDSGVPRPTARRVVRDAAWGAFAVRRRGPGNSRVGGPGVLPEGVRWPVSRGRPLSFVGAVDLSELPDFADRRLLPARGTLTFFAAVEDLFEPESGNRPGARLRVFYRGARTRLVPARRPRPTAKPSRDAFPEDGVLPSVPIALRPRLMPTLDVGTYAEPPLKVTEAVSRRYDRATSTWARRSGAPGYGGVGTTQVLGIPEGAQGDPREPGEVALLTVIPYELGGNFLDGGSIVFTMRRSDLRARRWSRISVVPDSG